MSGKKKYRIGEVAKILNIEAYVLRFWEKEFPQIAPFRTAKKQRFYTDKHIDLIRRIKSLLYEQGMTIAGARRLLAEDTEREPSSPGKEDGFMRMVEQELNDIRKLLRKP